MPPLELSEQEVRAFVGPRSSYYLQKWREGLDGEGKAKGINRYAFLLAGLWLPYRKMLRPAAILYGVVLIQMIFQGILCVRVLGMPKVPALMPMILGLPIAIICGAWGNQWYLSHARRAIGDLRSRSLAEDEYLRLLARRGGTSILAVIGCPVLFVITAIGMEWVLQLVIGRSR